MDKGQDAEASKNIKSPDRIQAEQYLDQYMFQMQGSTPKDDLNGKKINDSNVQTAKQRLKDLPDPIVTTILPRNEVDKNTDETAGERLVTYLGRFRDNGPWTLQENDSAFTLSGQLLRLPEEIRSRAENSKNGTRISIDNDKKSWEITIPKTSNP